jgi:hypothetical protein
MRQPPENAEQGRACAAASKPSPCRIAAAGRRRVRPDIDEPRLDLGAAQAVGVLRLPHQAGALEVGGEHDLVQGLGAGGRFLGHRADAHALRQRDRAGIGRQFAEDRPEQGGLARPVAADQTDAGPVGDREGRGIEDDPLADAVGEIVDAQHERRSGGGRRQAQGRQAQGSRSRGSRSRGSRCGSARRERFASLSVRLAEQR